MKYSVSIVAALLFVGGPSIAQSEGGITSFTALPTWVDGSTATGFWDTWAQGKTKLSFRYRAENVDSDALAPMSTSKLEEAFASTVRTTLSYETGVFKGMSGFVEFEDVAQIGEGNYNNSIAGDGNGDHAVVADPDSTEVNQAYLRYQCEKGSDVKLGRQEIVLGNARFVGNVGWRQNHQSFDALRATFTGLDTFTFDYMFIENANRIFSDRHPTKGDHEMTSHALNVMWDVADVGQATAYGYLLDYDDAVALSTNTFGVRFAGKQKMSENAKLLYAAEFAKQTDAGDNPTDIDVEYYLAEVGGGTSAITGRVGLEHLGGSGTMGEKFSTPLATLHKFNGFADVFLTTPDTGLDDLYASVQGKAGIVNWRATYHTFQADAGSRDYGTEIDIDASVAVSKRTKVGVKLASYDADNAATPDAYSSDVTKAMLWIQFNAF